MSFDNSHVTYTQFSKLLVKKETGMVSGVAHWVDYVTHCHKTNAEAI